MSEELLRPTPTMVPIHAAEATQPVRRKRGRPLEVQPHEVLGRIRELCMQNALFRVHLDAPALYARARRLFGTWASALDAAGVDHGATVEAARRRSLETRRGRRTRRAR